MKTVLRRSMAIVGMLTVLSMGLAHAATTGALSEKNASKTVSVKLGTEVSLTLHSMYWQLAVPPKSASLVSKGAPTLKPIFPSPNAPQGCRVAGSGCGTQTWNFAATKVGLTHLIASRSTCGEAMRCTGDNGRFEVTVKVTK